MIGLFPRFAAPFALAIALASPAMAQQVRYYEVPPGGRAHDVAVTPDGEVWWTVQRGGGHGILDPRTGQTVIAPLGEGSAPHGVIVGPDGNAWITDSGQNAIVRVDRATETFQSFPSDRPGANVRQMLGRPGEVWGAESGTDRLVVIRHGG